MLEYGCNANIPASSRATCRVVSHPDLAPDQGAQGSSLRRLDSMQWFNVSAELAKLRARRDSSNQVFPAS
jgi:hypothetical protein